jgi:hypothetical protein
MQRLSQLSSQLARESIYNSANNYKATPHRPKHNHPANTNTTMAKPKVVVTRQLIDEAQALLDAKKDDLEIVQWNSEKVCTSHPTPPFLIS